MKELNQIKVTFYLKLGGEPVLITRTEELLNAYFGTSGYKLDNFLEIIAKDNGNLNDMYTELKCILIWLNDEL